MAVSGDGEKDGFVGGRTTARGSSQDNVVEIRVRDKSFSRSRVGQMDSRNS